VCSLADDADSEVLRLMTEVAEASRQRVALEAQLAAVQRSDGAARGQLDQARVRNPEADLNLSLTSHTEARLKCTVTKQH